MFPLIEWLFADVKKLKRLLCVYTVCVKTVSIYCVCISYKLCGKPCVDFGLLVRQHGEM